MNLCLRPTALALPLVFIAACGASSATPDEASQGPTEDAAAAAAGGSAGRGGDAGAGGKSSSGGASGTGGASGSKGTGGASGTDGGPGAGGTSGTGGGGGAPPFVPPKCANGSTTLPADAPVLTPGVWTQINPASVSFGPHGGSRDQDVFTQNMVIDPCNSATLYLSVCANPPTGTTATPGVYRSTNAGTTWTKLGNIDAPINVRVDPKDPLHLYVGDGVRGAAVGFWVSHDGGASWAQPQGFLDVARTKLNGDTDVYRVEPDPTDFSHVLLSFHWYWDGCANGCTSGIIESFDGGDTWTVHDPIPGLKGAGGYDVLFLYNPALGIGDAKTWLFGTQGAGYYRTTDAGATWTKVTDNSMDHGGGQLYYTKTGTLYSGGVPHLMKSTDNGVTWQLGQNDSMPNFGYIGIVGDGTHLYTSSHDHDAPFQTSLETDGLKWTSYSSQISHAGAFEMAYDAANGIVYSANEYDGLLALKVQ